MPANDGSHCWDRVLHSVVDPTRDLDACLEVRVVLRARDLITRPSATNHRLRHQMGVSNGGVEFLLRQGYHRALGTRPLPGAVERYLQDAVAADILAAGNGSGRLVVDRTSARFGSAPSLC